MRVAECFVDTNVLVYAIGTLAEESGKAAAARNILATKDWAWSAQVAAESF